ncbi:UBP-type zinc finger domain-containing protein [Chitinophaga rhizosphaerae]|uniref:UBP-type zinc finger domain-containing protein n=1 Tax=Chitinophaga rhizosphaerae TaxID=1864947 RepID=UPI000F80BA4C|nr:UBP-type zinc finger domain-containing protein [Chitinophaga rhizosphaerae]
MADKPCQHILQLERLVHPKKHECEECVKTGGTWLHLRTCQTCGGTFCCDSSPSRHMTAHFHASGHPVVISAEPGEQWIWCYEDQSFAEY